jgi:uncharacterized damage-inducible protein DinB
MSTPALAFTFQEMLAAQQVEFAKWEHWLLQQPASLLDLPLDAAKGEDLRSVLSHIFVVELYFGQSLNDRRDFNAPVDDLLSLPSQTFDDLFAVHQRGVALLEQWAANATLEDTAKILVRGELRVSKKKCFIQVMEHTVRHFAQTAMALRQTGHPTDWLHDFIFNSSML